MRKGAVHSNSKIIVVINLIIWDENVCDDECDDETLCE